VTKEKLEMFFQVCLKSEKSMLPTAKEKEILIFHFSLFTFQ